MKKRIILFLSVAFIAFSAFSQQNKAVNSELQKQGELDWSNENYKLSVSSYEKLIKASPENVEFCYRFGIANFLAGFEPEKSLKALEPLIGKTDAPNDVSYWIGQLYMNIYQFADAIDMFNTYIASPGVSQLRIAETKRLIEMCESAIELMNKPVNVSFENLGPNINSSSNDFNPFVPENEEFLVFSSDKKFDLDAKMFDQNMYISFPEKSGWAIAHTTTLINTPDNEKTVGLSADGKKLFVCGNFAKLYSDVYTAILKGKQFKFDPAENCINGLGNKLTTGATIPADNSVIYFSAVRDDSKGEGDIYYIRLLPNGQWGKPKGISDAINTPYDEIYPSVSPDGKTLYFSSKGHNSMGGYDLFVSYLNEINGDWTKPINIGYPINTPGDNFIISFSKDRRYAYTSLIRKEGLGGHDIYRVTFKDVDEPITLMKGKIKIKDGTNISEWNKENNYLDISVFDSHQNLFGKYIYNGNLKRFVSALPAGEYKLVISADGFQEYSETISILEHGLFQPEIEKEFLLLLKKQ